jgi:2,4-dienoyl-CoA reductase-like NADH-dependent reductase (Old Yellow Enzyme family)/thioredoxin reductase
MTGLKRLFSTYNIGAMELKNRIIMGPMGTNLSNPDGSVAGEEIAYYEARARGGAGMIITEMVVIDERGKYQPRIPMISEDRHIRGWQSLVEAVHAHGTKIAIQLGHAGRETFPDFINGLQPVAPSAVPPPTGIIPHELTAEEIQDLVNKYAQAAGRAMEAGIDAIQVHGAHCYLMANFMSPITNKRCDEYGGGIEGRLRFSLEVVRAIRKRVGAELPLLFRIAAEELTPGGRSLEETKVMCRLLVDAGIDAIEVSRGSLAALRWVVPPMGTPVALNVQYASEIKDTVGVPILTVGRINEPMVAEQILETGKADLVVMARALLADPDLPKKAFLGMYEDIVPCIACNQCLFTVMGGVPLNCTMNPAVGREDNFQIVPSSRSKKVMVIGGGPAGLEAARTASLRGHQVILYEMDRKLGGQLKIASVPPAKQELTKAIGYLSAQAEKSGVQMEIGKTVTPGIIAQTKPDAVVVATGAGPVIPDIPGVDNPKVSTVPDVLSSKVAVGQKVLIVGGGLAGAETADYLAGLSTDITIVEMTEAIASDMVLWQREFLVERLSASGVKIITSAVVREFLDDGVVFIKDDKEARITGFDTIILAMGNQTDKRLYDDLKEFVTERYIIGDASMPRNALDAIREGAECGRNI